MKLGCHEAQVLYEDNTKGAFRYRYGKAKATCQNDNGMGRVVSQQVGDVIKLVLFVLIAVGYDWLLVIIWAIASHTHGGKLADFL